VAFLASLYPYWGEAAAFAVSAAAALLWDWQASDIAWGLWISSLVTGWVILGASICGPGSTQPGSTDCTPTTTRPGAPGSNRSSN